MMLPTLLLAQASADLSLDRLRSLSPEVAGAEILHDRPHGPVEHFQLHPHSIMPPGTIWADLVERPSRAGSICVRTIWTITFRASPKADMGTALLHDTSARQQIALEPQGPCSSEGYVHLNPGIGIDRGRDALARLRVVTAAGSHTRFQCSDQTPSGLCKGDAAIRATLRLLKPWAISDDEGDTLIWLGTPGYLVTELRFAPSRQAPIAITRRYPASF